MHFSSYNAWSLNNSYLNEADKVIFLMRRVSGSLFIYPEGVKEFVFMWKNVEACLFDLLSIICELNFQANMKFQADYYVCAEFHGSILLQTLLKKKTL